MARRNVFDPDQAARVMCATVENGHSQEDIERAAQERGCWVFDEDPECERKRRQAIELALSAIEGNQQTLAIAEAAINAIGIAIRIMLVVSRVVPIPALRVASVGLSLASGQLTAVRLNIARRRAANDDLFRAIEALRRAA